MSADDAKIRALADLLADPGIREIWEQELWEAFADPIVRWRFEQETGLGREENTNDLPYRFTDTSESEDNAYAFAFMEWFNQRCWQHG